MKNLITTLLFFTLSAFVVAVEAAAKESFSIYLVRHAEKQKDKQNPSLTSCGQLRAKQLATLLAEANIKTIYSTQYKRTLATAQPLSAQQHIAVRHYSAKDLPQVAQHLLAQKENMLVVGHSNTTPQLTQLLSGEKVPPIADNQYQVLYQIQFIENHKILTEFKQPLSCY